MNTSATQGIHERMKGSDIKRFIFSSRVPDVTWFLPAFPYTTLTLFGCYPLTTHSLPYAISTMHNFLPWRYSVHVFAFPPHHTLTYTEPLIPKHITSQYLLCLTKKHEITFFSVVSLSLVVIFRNGHIHITLFLVLLLTVSFLYILSVSSLPAYHVHWNVYTIAIPAFTPPSPHMMVMLLLEHFLIIELNTTFMSTSSHIHCNDITSAPQLSRAVNPPTWSYNNETIQADIYVIYNTDVIPWGCISP